MLIARLPRLEMSDQGALGVLMFNEHCFCCTLEPDKEDPDRLYIPQGVYTCKRFHGKKWPNTFEILVKGHTAVLFHAGNVEADSTGCILLGSSFGNLKGQRAVLNSGATFKKFLDITANYNTFPLLITDHYLLPSSKNQEPADD